MTPAANGDVEVERPRELHRGDDIGDSGAAGNQGRVFVYQAVVDPAEIVVALIGGAKQPSLKRLRGLIYDINK